MNRRDQIRCGFLVVTAAFGLIVGCSSKDHRPTEHASTSLLDTGPSPRITRKQAADVEFALGRSMEEEGNAEAARPAYLAVLEKDPKRADAEHRLAILDDRKGDTVNAEKHFARALKLQPKDPEILCDRGYNLYLHRRWAEAETSLKKALAADPTHARSHANLGLVLAQRGDHPAALAEFAKAGCDSSDARSNLALVLALEGRFEDSRREYALALLAKPGSPRASEGLKAANVAMAGQLETRAIAANGQAAPRVDPALIRTSTTSNPQ